MGAAFTVAGLIGGLNNLGRRLAGLVDHRGNEIRGGIGVFFQRVEPVGTREEM